MNETLAKYILSFLAIIYLTSSIAEIILVKNGAEMVFQSVEKLVPHMGMFILGTLFSKK